MMGDGFTKLYGDKLLRSTLWLEPPEARLVFLAMLAIADANGLVDIPSVKVLANVLNLDLEYVQRALAILEAPDPDSRSADADGRRLLRPESGGWQCVNYIKYREYRGAKVEETRKRVAKHRAKKRAESATPVTECNDVTPGNCQRQTPEADAEADTPQAPVGGGPTPRQILESFAECFTALTGRLEFAKGIDEARDSDRQWLRDMRDMCGGDVAELERRVAARMSEKGDFYASQSLKYWVTTALNAPAAPPTPVVKPPKAFVPPPPLTDEEADENARNARAAAAALGVRLRRQ